MNRTGTFHAESLKSLHKRFSHNILQDPFKYLRFTIHGKGVWFYEYAVLKIFNTLFAYMPPINAGLSWTFHT